MKTAHMCKVTDKVWLRQMYTNKIFVCRCTETTAETDRPRGAEPQHSHLPGAGEVSRHGEEHRHPATLDDRGNLLHSQQEEVWTDA